MSDEQNVGTPAQVPTNPPPHICESCGQQIPPIDLSTANLPKMPPEASDLVLTAAQAVKFRNAYLELFKFWWEHNFPMKGTS